MKVEIYFNLHKRLFSVRERHGKVLSHEKWIGMIRPTFAVQQGGREKVLRDKSKNVHAFVRPESIWGDSSTTDTYLLSKANGVPDFDQTLTDYTTVRYNPYKYTSFVDENEDPIFEADVGFMYLDKQNKPVIKVASLDPSRTNTRNLITEIPRMTVTTKELNDLFRECKDIGMAASDRPINDTKNHEGSCIHRTDYCDQTCYNIKLYNMYENMANRDDRCETIWQKLDKSNSDFTNFFSRKKYDTSRVRHMTRGEAFKDIRDVYRVKTMCLLNPDILWWIPTRAWRNPRIKSLIEKELMTLDNCAINASLDPSNSEAEWQMLIDDDWNIMFYGDDTLTHDPVYGKRMFACPKTHKGLKGHCKDCKAGCFAQKTINRTQIVHLSEH